MCSKEHTRGLCIIPLGSVIDSITEVCRGEVCPALITRWHTSLYRAWWWRGASGCWKIMFSKSRESLNLTCWRGDWWTRGSLNDRSDTDIRTVRSASDSRPGAVPLILDSTVTSLLRLASLPGIVIKSQAISPLPCSRHFKVIGSNPVVRVVGLLEGYGSVRLDQDVLLTVLDRGKMTSEKVALLLGEGELGGRSEVLVASGRGTVIRKTGIQTVVQDRNLQGPDKSTVR